MATNNLMNQITSTYSKMTKAEKKVADFVLSSPAEVLHATITDLAQLCKVGETSVFRFCRTLSLNGYQDFKLSLALSTSLQSDNMRENINVTDSPSEEERSYKIKQAYTASLDATLDSLNFKQVKKAVKLLSDARMIHFFGFGGSGVTAIAAHNKFSKIIPYVSYNRDSHLQLSEAALLGGDDVALILCNSGVTKDCIEIAKLANKAGASVIFVTKFAKTPAAQYSDVILLCGANEGPMEGGSIAAQISQLFLIDILYSEIFLLMGKKAIENKQITAQVITDKMM